MSKSNQPRVVVLSSVSGGGKNTVARKLLECTDALQVAITATSRSPRSGEVDGKDYIFLDRSDFEARIADGDFLEHATVHGNLYGVPESSVTAILDKGKSAVLIIDVQGRSHIESKMGDRMISIFLMPPDRAEWEQRLRQRGTDTEAEISLRLQDGLKELEEAEAFDHVIVNDSVDACTERLLEILREEGAV